jgi:hypothetical protein
VGKSILANLTGWNTQTCSRPIIFFVLWYVLLEKKHVHIEYFGTNLHLWALFYILSTILPDFGLIFRKCNSFNKFNIKISSMLCNILSIQNKRRKSRFLRNFIMGRDRFFANQIIHLSCEVMLWRHFKIKFVLIPPCIHRASSGKILPLTLPEIA